MEFPKNLLYTKQHEWILQEGDFAKVGITDYAQNQLGDVVFVQMPQAGTVLAKGEPFGAVESVKAASDVYAPAGGEVIETNQALDGHPEYLNQSPYGEGWIIRVRLSDQNELKELMDSSAYTDHVQKESAQQ
jgi:glycine cleavage system H protein